MFILKRIFVKLNTKKLQKVMKKSFIISILIFFNSIIYSQTFKYVWLSELNIGHENSDQNLEVIVENINSIEEVKFVFITGNLTISGTDKDFETAKEILDKLNVPYLVIPGNQDVKQSESGTAIFTELFDDNKFSYSQDSIHYIGLNSCLTWQTNIGHFSPEDLNWLREELSGIEPNQEIYFIVHYPFDKSIDNWFKVTNTFSEHNLQAIYFGDSKRFTEKKFHNIKAIGVNPSLDKKKKSGSFTLITNTPDSLILYKHEIDNPPKLLKGIKKLKKNEIKYILADPFKNLRTIIKWKHSQDFTLSVPPLVYKNKIYTADQAGLVSCFDSTGKIIWEYDAFGDILSKPAAADNMIAIATLQGDLITIDANTGESIQTIGFDEAITSDLLIIDYQGNKETMVPKISKSNAAVILGTASGKLFCYDLETLEQLWKNEDAKGLIETQPFYISNKIIFGSRDNQLYSIDAREGWLIWKWRDTRNLKFSAAGVQPVSDGKNVFVTSSDGFVYALDLQLGKIIWKNKKYKAYKSLGISIDKRVLYVKSNKDKFHLIDAKNGKWIKEMKINYGEDFFQNNPIEWNGNIIFGAQNGNVYKIYKSNEKYKTEKLMFMGNAPVHTMQHFKENKFVVSNYDGEIVLFEIK